MNPLHAHLLTMARAMGPELREISVFVGGATVFLYVDDPDVAQLRATEDVDVIVELTAYSEWPEIERLAAEAGFVPSLIEDDPICRFRNDGLILDIMPTDATILGFTNPWYETAFRTARPVELEQGLPIRLVQLPYFLATKLAAYRGRGNDDPMASRDIEDALSVIGGRRNLEREFDTFEKDVKRTIGESLDVVQAHRDFGYTVQSAFPGTRGEWVKATINNLVKLSRL